MRSAVQRMQHHGHCASLYVVGRQGAAVGSYVDPLGAQDPQVGLVDVAAHAAAQEARLLRQRVEGLAGAAGELHGLVVDHAVAADYEHLPPSSLSLVIMKDLMG